MKKLILSLKDVYFEEINFDFKDFNFSFPLKTEYFINLISSEKPFYPPILYETEKNYLIVDGLARISALKHFGAEPFKALILEAPLPFKELLLISLELNLQRNLNLVEKAYFLVKAEKYFSKEELLHLLPRLGFSKNQNWFFYLKNILLLEDPFKMLIASEKLNPKIVESLIELTPEERSFFLKLIEKLNLSFNEQREILETLRDYKKLTNQKWLFPPEIEKALEIEDFNQRKKVVFETLYQLKYPNYFSKKKIIEKIRSLFSAYGINFDVPPYLEKKEVTLQFKVKDIEDLKKILKFLEDEGEKLFSLFE
ncbi:MAG: hypothetical protein ACPLWD_07455 [Caldimicrobium thiodismutans]